MAHIYSLEDNIRSNNRRTNLLDNDASLEYAGNSQMSLSSCVCHAILTCHE